MSETKIVSFDVDGTLVTLDFSYCVWFEAIPRVYAEKNGLEVAEARRTLKEEYDRIGDQRLEWYDIHYWFRCLDLGDPQQVLTNCTNVIAYYPDVIETLASLKPNFRLIAASSSPREFLDYILRDIEPYFERVFSSISDLCQLKSADFYLHICQETGVSPQEIVHIGDSWQLDYLFPRQVDIQAFYLDRKGQNQNHQHTLASLTDLKPLLLG